jgi:hypothetical protein
MAGDDDVYRVLLDTETDVDFDLWNIPPHTDYDLYVFGPDHANLGESIGDGTTDETIHLHLLPGTYYFRVFPNEGLSPQSYRVRWFPHP